MFTCMLMRGSDNVCVYVSMSGMCVVCSMRVRVCVCARM